MMRTSFHCGSSRERGFVLLAVVWLMAGLSLLVLGVSEGVLDELRLTQDRQQAVQLQVTLENDWQCIWWFWQQDTMHFPHPAPTCTIKNVQVQWDESLPQCAAAKNEQCRGAWVTLEHAQADHCRQLRQFVLQHIRFDRDGQQAGVRLWRGQRRWQSCAPASS